MRVIIVSRTFPGYHPKAGQSTYFVDKILSGIPFRNWGRVPDEIDQYPERVKRFRPKLHTIRAGNRWKVGDMASLRYWSGRPYHSKQVEFAEVEIKKVWPIRIYTDNNIEIQTDPRFWTSLSMVKFQAICKNDGLTESDFYRWFKMPVKETFIGQIICWSDKVNY